MKLIRKQLSILLTLIIGLSLFTTVPFTANAALVNANDTLTVVGSSWEIFGAAWDAAYSANDMQHVEGTDNYTITYSNVQPKNDIKFKIVKNHSWDESWGDSEGGNFIFNVISACDVTITFNAAEGVISVTGDHVIVSPVYTVTWMDSDGTVLETDTNVEKGAPPSYDADTPIKADDDEYTYIFSGWTDGVNTYGTGDTLPAVTANVIYLATYTARDKASYTVVGSSWEIFGAAWDAAYSANDMQHVEGTDNYTITYSNVQPKNDIKFKIVKNHSWDESWGDSEGDNFIFNVISACDVTITFNAADGVISVTGDHVIVGPVYTVTWVNGNTVLETDKYVPYGTIPTYDGETPTKEADENYGYIFAGWSPDISEVTGDVTYIAQFVSEFALYIDENGDSCIADSITELTAGITTLEAGWYSVTSDITISSRINCSGDVHLILCDGKTLTAPKGITVNEDSSLTIYGQSGGTGALLIDDVDDTYAAIGGGGNSGLITINGGNISVKGGYMGAGIGGSGYDFAGSDADGFVTINGGTIEATGGFCGAGIGGGVGGAGTVIIRGGAIRATGGIGASGIGGYNTEVYRSTVSLGWKNAGDSIRALKNINSDIPAYCGTITLENYFRDGSEVFPYGEIDSSVLEGKTLVPYEVKDWSDLQTLINSDIVGKTITLDKDYTAESGDTALIIPSGKELTIDLNGFKLDRNLSAADENGRVIVNNGTLTIKDSSAAQTGTVTGAYFNSDGGAILNNKNCTLNIKGGIFTGNVGNHGGVVYNMGVMNMSAGSMYGNTANGNGGAVWNGRQGVLNLSGGKITQNTVGGVGAVYSRHDGTLNVSGSPVVTGNSSENIYLRNAIINVVGTLDDGAKLAVTREDVTDGFVFTDGLSGNGNADSFISDNTDFAVCLNSSGEAEFKKIYITTINYTYNIYDEGTSQLVEKTITKTLAPSEYSVQQIIELNEPYIKSAYLEYGDYTYEVVGDTINVQISDTDKKYTVTLNGEKIGEYSYLEKATINLNEEKSFIIDGKVVYVGESYSFYVGTNTDIITDVPTELNEYADISLNGYIIDGDKVSLDLLATAKVGEGEFERMGVAFALSEKSADEIAAAVDAVKTGTAVSDRIAVHNSYVDWYNQSGQYQFRFAPYFDIGNAKNSEIYFYTYVVLKDGSVKVSSAAQYDMKNLLA